MSGKLFLLISFVVAMCLLAPLCSATIGPISSVVTDNPEGSPPYNVQSVTVGSYTVDRVQLASGTSTGTLGFTPDVPIPEIDDLDISFAWSNGETGDEFTVHMFNGKLWRDSNGDNPDFFLFEAGTGDSFGIAAILPGGVIGQSITLSGPWGSTGHNSNGRSIDGNTTGNGQAIVGISWAITDLLDNSGNALTNNSIIEGIAVTNRNGGDPADWFAVIPPAFQAREPNPADGATDVRRDVVLSWSPGETASTHNVYFGVTFVDVNDAGVGSPLSVSPAQIATTYDPDGLLDFGQTHYWRIDEVAVDGTVHKGEVWSFTTEPVGYPIDGANITATASSVAPGDFGPEKTIDGSGLNANDGHSTNPVDMWLSASEPQGGIWIQYEFDRVYKLHQMWVWNSNQTFEAFLGYGPRDVTVEYSTDGAEWTTLAGAPEFAQAPAPATEDYRHNTTVDLGGAVAKYVKLTVNSNWGTVLPQSSLSEVRFFQIPASARTPSPDSGATDVSVDVTLGWRAGRGAVTHNVSFSADEQAVIDGTAPVAVAAGTSYSPADLALNTSYYWRVDEVNDAETPTTWQSDIWSFTTQEYIVVDDFESYNNIDPPDADSNRIFEGWPDGFGVATNGALVGYDPPQPSYAETVIVHGGSQSMPMFYSNTLGAAFSEVTRTFAAQNWTDHGVQTLSLWFHGNPTNTPGQLYVKINGVKVSYPGAAASLSRPLWQRWNIDLASVGGVQNVTSLAVGVEGPGATGTLLVDDIGLHQSVPAAAEEIYLEAEAGALGARWRTYIDPASSGGQHIGSEVGDGDDNNTAPAAEWIATYSFSAAGGTYKVVLRAQENGFDSFWVRIVGATSQTHEHPAQAGTGWVRFNGVDAPDGWAWDEVHSDDHGQAVVNWTLPAGTHTLAIGKREAGVLLDAILITSDLD